MPDWFADTAVRWLIGVDIPVGVTLALVDDLATWPLGALSGGQRQRAWTRRLVGKWGETIAAVLPDINHAARFADHLCLLKDGRIITSVSARDISSPAFSTELS